MAERQKEEDILWEEIMDREFQKDFIKLELLPMKKRRKFVHYGRVEYKRPRFIKKINDRY